MLSPTLRRILTLVAAFVALSFMVVLAGQTVQLAAFAERLHPVAGQVVFWGLLAAYVALVGIPLLLYFRMPRALVPPERAEGPEFEAHIQRLRERLGRNPAVQGESLETTADVERALVVLDGRAEAVVRAAGSRAFLLTAVSQNGALDALIVLGLQSKLVLDVARVYAQRATPREVTWLYANVFATAFVAGEIQDAEMAEVVQPVVSTVLGSAASALPGLQVASSVFTSSVLSGAANAFLTLRVGVIAQEYSRALVRPKRATLRRTAVVRAAGMLGGIVAAGATTVSAAIARAAGRTAKGAMTGIGRRMMEAGDAVTGRMPFRRREGPQGPEGPEGPEGPDGA